MQTKVIGRFANKPERETDIMNSLTSFGYRDLGDSFEKDGRLESIVNEVVQLAEPLGCNIEQDLFLTEYTGGHKTGEFVAGKAIRFR